MLCITLQLTAESARGIVEALNKKPVANRIAGLKDGLRCGFLSVEAKEIYRAALARAESELSA